MLDYLFSRRRTDQQLGHLFHQRISAGSVALNRALDRVLRVPKLDIGTKERPVRSRFALVGHSNASGIDRADIRDVPVELDVRMSCDEDALGDVGSQGAKSALGCLRGHQLLIAAR